MATIRELDPADAPALTDLYAEYPWWADREEADVRAALESTEVALALAGDEGGGSNDEDTLLAAARVLTDYQYYAMVYDVVAADRRGEGLGAQLMTAVTDHPDLQDLPGVALLCREGLVPFYESVGFERHGEDVDVPEGGTEDLVRLRYVHED